MLYSRCLQMSLLVCVTLITGCADTPKSKSIVTTPAYTQEVKEPELTQPRVSTRKSNKQIDSTIDGSSNTYKQKKEVECKFDLTPSLYFDLIDDLNIRSASHNMKYKEIIVFYQDVEPECIKELSKNYISTTDPVLKIALRMIQSGYFGKNYKFSNKAGVEELLEATPVIYFDNSMTPLIVTQLQEMVAEANSANESIALDEGVGCLMSGTYSIEECFQKPHTRLMLSLPHTKSLFCEQKIQVGLRATDINLADNDKPKNTACSL